MLNPDKLRNVQFILMALCLLGGLGLACMPVEQRNPWALHMLMLLVGPLLSMLDKKVAPEKTLLGHHLITGARLLLLVGFCALLPPGFQSFGGLMFTFYAAYLTALLNVQDFLIKPEHWLRYDHIGNTSFLTVSVLGIVMEIGLAPWARSTGVWFLCLFVLGVTMAWRHALWYHVPKDRDVAPHQHDYIWPTLAARTDSGTFWVRVFPYFLLYPQSQRHVLASLPLPVLLSFFKPVPVLSTQGATASPVHQNLMPPNMYKLFIEEVKAAINQKEPRAAFVWHLYEPSEAVLWIAKIDEFAARAKDSDALDLPPLT